MRVRVEPAAMGRVLELARVTAPRLCFGLENLIFPRLFLLGISLKPDFYWEIGVKSIALKSIKAFASKMYLFFFFFEL